MDELGGKVLWKDVEQAEVGRLLPRTLPARDGLSNVEVHRGAAREDRRHIVARVDTPLDLAHAVYGELEVGPRQRDGHFRSLFARIKEHVGL